MSSLSAAFRYRPSPRLYRVVKWMRRHYILTMLYAFVLWLVSAGLYTAFTYPGNAYSTDFSVRQYMVARGFDPAKSYPLTLGVAGQAGSSNQPSVNLLTGHDAVVQGLQPSTSVRLNLQVGLYSYIVEVPFKQVQFIRKDGTGSARFVVNNYLIGKVPPRLTPYGFTSFWTFTNRGFADRQNTIRDSGLWQSIQRNGFVWFLQQSLIRVDITISSQQYKQYLGGS